MVSSFVDIHEEEPEESEDPDEEENYPEETKVNNGNGVGPIDDDNAETSVDFEESTQKERKC